LCALLILKRAFGPETKNTVSASWGSSSPVSVTCMLRGGYPPGKRDCTALPALERSRFGTLLATYRGMSRPNDPRPGELEHEIALLREEIRVKDARLARIPAPQRPHYKAHRAARHSGTAGRAGLVLGSDRAHRSSHHGHHRLREQAPGRRRAESLAADH